ncbi:hypothetical protein C6Q03_14630 [Burkholderia multivorans]|nr:hypothetical protein C6Q03_14630 [Burkholderia multivorans]
MPRPTRSSRSCGKPSTRSRSGISPWRGKCAIRLFAFSLRQLTTGAVVRKYGGVFFLRSAVIYVNWTCLEVRRAFTIAAEQSHCPYRSDST